MKICICGGGSLGHVCAGVLASQKNVIVNILSGHPEKWGREITVTDSFGNIYSGTIESVSNNPAEVVPNSDIIFLCIPGFLIRETLAKIKPFIGEAVVGSVVSSTGFFFEAHSLLGSNVKLFGFQRVPFIARVQEYGKTARLLGYKSQLNVAVENIIDIERFRLTVARLWLTPTKILDNIYAATLTNSNPILHTGRLFSLFHKWDSIPFDHQILFYKEWDLESSEIILKMDEEFGILMDALGINEKEVPSLLKYYESNSAEDFTTKIKSIPAFDSIPAPMVNNGKGWIPDLNSRYFMEDFPYGLRYIWELTNERHVRNNMIEEVYFWGMNLIRNTTQYA
jgi:hypothetical protein